MVLPNGTGQNTRHQQRMQWKVGHAHISTHNPYDSVKKNELLYPISPYDEIPAIRDLAKKLSPEPRQDPGVLRESFETRQTRQEALRNSHRQSLHQERDTGEKKFGAPSSFPLFINDAHEVPTTIELDKKPSFSEDSGVSLDEFLRSSGESYHDGRSSTLHLFDACDHNSQLSPFDVHPSYHAASVDVREDMEWPSDEDTEPANKRTSKRGKAKGINV